MDHLLRYENDEDTKMMVVLGEVRTVKSLLRLTLKSSTFQTFFDAKCCF